MYSHCKQRVIALFLLLCIFLSAFPATGLSQEAVDSATVQEATQPANPFDEVMPHLDLSDKFPQWAQRGIAGIAFWQMLLAFVFILLGFALKKLSDHIIRNRIIPILEKTKWSADDLLAEAALGPVGMLFFIVGLGSAFAVLPLPQEPNISGFSYGIIKIFFVVNFIWFLFRCVDALAEFLKSLSRQADSKIDHQIIPLIRKAMKATVAVICSVWLLQVFGYNVSSLIAGLGIGGLAVALALQDPLSNFFASIILFLDKPFLVGDWVKVDDAEGIVESIGFRTSQIRTWPKTLVSIPNKTVASAVIENLSKMTIRMNVQTIGVTYETDAGQMEALLQRIKDFLADDEDLTHELTIVRFTDFGDSSLNVMVRFYTKSLGYDDYLATRERINLGTMRIVEEMGLSIAFPTRSIYLEGDLPEAFSKHLKKQESEKS